MLIRPIHRPASALVPPRCGFTLLEVILAVAIFAGAIAILSRLFVIGVENAEWSEWEAEAWLVAESRWAEIESGIRPLTPSTPATVEEMPGWEWGLNVEPAGPTDLYRVTVLVQRPPTTPNTPPYSVELTRLFFDDTANRQEATSSP